MRTLQQFYGAKSRNPFGTQGQFYSAVGHRGDDYDAAGHEAIPSWVEGTVLGIFWGSGLGYSIAVRAGDKSIVMGQAHLLGSGRSANPTLTYGPKVGDHIALGASVGVATTYGDDHGSLWDGSHSHTTAGPTSAAALGAGVVNPRPYIEAALSRAANTITAGSGPLTLLEDDMYTDEDRIRDVATAANAAEARRLSAAALGVPVDMTGPELDAFLRDRGNFDNLAETRRMLGALIRSDGTYEGVDGAGQPIGEQGLRERLERIESALVKLTA